jgi:hypothetical protein
MGGRDAVKMTAWIKPKTAHKHMVQQLLQVRAHLILCFRAEQKIDMVKGDDGKTKIVPKESPVGLSGWIPICEKNLPYELTASFLLTADAPGVPKPIKLQAQHKSLFPLDKPITEESGKKLAAWAHGSAASSPNPPTSHQGAAAFITPAQVFELEMEFAGCDKGAEAAFLKVAKLASIANLAAADYAECKDWIARRKAKAA